MSEASKFIAIAGNPNSGKTTAFNWYTGARQHVGNYPGITVEKKEGTAHLAGKSITLVDLPGTYSLSAYSLEEVVARRVLSEDRPGAVLNVINAAVLERNLYLSVQIQEMGLPVVLALNMMDEARAQGIRINVKRLEERTGMKAVPTVARTGEGLEEALTEAVKIAEETGGRCSPLEISYGPDVDQVLGELTPLVEKAELLTQKYPARWVALKYIERDSEVIKQGREANAELSDRLTAAVNKLADHLKTTLNTYPEAVIADYRYGYISSTLREGVVEGLSNVQDRIAYSDKMDRVLTHRLVGPVILALVLYLVYYLTIELGDYPLGWTEAFFGWLNETVGGMMPDGLLKSLVTSGIIDGVGGVLGFVPLIMIMFLLIAFLEDSGYMARVAYMLDRIFRFFGLHGASVMPFIVSGGIAGGCAVPGVMATRTLRSPRERLATMLTAPFMACGAKVPVFLLLVSIFFEKNQALVMFLLTLSGWVAALLVARLLRSTIIRGEATPFVMELPPYRLPTLSGLLIHTWERSWQYIKKAGTIILAISILIWAAMTFPGLPEDKNTAYDQRVEQLEQELAATPYKQLSDSVSEIETELAALAPAAPDAAEVKTRLEAAQTALQDLPASRLQAEIDDLTEQLAKLPEAPQAEELKSSLENYRASLAVLKESDAGAEAIRQQLEKTEAAYAKTPSGAIQVLLDARQEELDALPEKQIEARMAEVENERSAETLRLSYAGRLGTALESITKPAGFDWRTNIALIGGIAAKEVVISTLGTAYSLGEVEEDDVSLADRIRADSNWTQASATALLLFTLLYSPCFVTLAVIRKESGEWKWLFFSLFFNLALAYGVAVAANQIIMRL